MKQIKPLLFATAMLASAALASGAEATLKVGDPAPKLQTGKWVQGDPVKEFSKDKVYIVEFWATWCGPCRATIPHLNEIYEKFKDKGLVVVGQNVWERDESLVKPFVEKMGSKMTYNVALDDKSSEEDGAMAVTWMKAAGQNGIPAAFLVGKDGKLAWIGHPGSLKNEMVQEVIDGKFDVKKAAAAADEQKKNQAELRKLGTKLGEQIQGQEWDEAEKTINEMAKLLPAETKDAMEYARMQVQLGKGDMNAAAKTAEKVTRDIKDPMRLNEISWRLLTHESGIKGEALDCAYKIAERANTAAEGKDPAIMDTLARATFMKGEKQKAIELQEKAIKLADDEDMKKSLQDALDSYKEGKLPKVDSE